MKHLPILLATCLSLHAGAQHPAAGLTAAIDLGYPKTPGRARFDTSTQAWTLAAAGQYADLNREEAVYAHRRMGGDFILTADFAFADPGRVSMRRMGWMVRESLRDDAAHVAGFRQGDGRMVMQWRRLQGAYLRIPQDRRISAKRGMQTLQLERRGQTFTLRAALPGEPLQPVGEVSLPDMPDSVTVGIFLAAQDASQPDSGQVWNLRIDKPAPDRYHPDPLIQRTLDRREPALSSRLETIDIETGRRRILHRSTGRFEAPNWMPDGARLLFNQQGRLLTVDTAGGNPSLFPTGSVDRNNNDHGISFDGRQLALSSHFDGPAGAGSAVYVMPLAGGEPRRVNDNVPSYWHGWSPDGRQVLVVGQRNGMPTYNIYQVDVRTGKEADLTRNTHGHVDGPEYAPDGKYIYYNADASGTMQLWRMRPDGSDKERLTFDEYNNWFPHLSPDGKWIAFVSFPTDIDPASHPSGKKVMLRIMPASGGAPRVIAHLYGGQGTMNVNSWSPDSRRLAFVSNSAPERRGD
jgi:TolB protein